MFRRAFLRRMALAAAACAFIDVPWRNESTSVPVPDSSMFRIGPVDFNLTTGEIRAPQGTIAAIRNIGRGYKQLCVWSGERGIAAVVRAYGPCDYRLDTLLGAAKAVEDVRTGRSI